MSHSVHFENPAYSPDSPDDVISVSTNSKVRNDNADGDNGSEDTLFFDEDEGSEVNLDLTELNPYKFESCESFRVGPVPIAQSTEFVSSGSQVAILSKNADGKNFDQLKDTLKTVNNGSIADLLSRSACDAFLAYFYELSNKGSNAKVDYNFLNNLLTGEGSKLIIFNQRFHSFIDHTLHI